MIFITHSETYRDCSFLIGVLMDPITDADFGVGIFRAYLASDQIRNIVCEKPKYVSGLGTKMGDVSFVQFKSRLFGLREYPTRSSHEGILFPIVENRIRLLTSIDLRDVAFLAILSTVATSASIATPAVVRLD